jgi:hypothetical protein
MGTSSTTFIVGNWLAAFVSGLILLWLLIKWGRCGVLCGGATLRNSPLSRLRTEGTGHLQVRSTRHHGELHGHHDSRNNNCTRGRRLVPQWPHLEPPLLACCGYLATLHQRDHAGGRTVVDEHSWITTFQGNHQSPELGGRLLRPLRGTAKTHGFVREQPWPCHQRRSTPYPFSTSSLLTFRYTSQEFF